MNSFNDNCCFKLNYFICGSNKFSLKKKNIKFQKKSIENNIQSNNKIIYNNKLSFSTFNEKSNINMTLFEQKKSLQKTSKYNQNDQMIKNLDYKSSLDSSIDHQSFNQSHLILNNQLIIKDIILYRKNLNERFGLTLCYGIKSKSKINIYIKKIDKYSIADYQGELQSGDQIIQINYFNVTNRDQAIHILNQNKFIIFKIIRYPFFKENFSKIKSIITDDHTQIILYNKDFQINKQKSKSYSLPCLLSNNYLNSFYIKQIKFRHCLSLNDLKNSSLFYEKINHFQNSIKSLINSENLFNIQRDNEKGIVKPLPFRNNHNNKYSFNSNDIYLKENIKNYFIKKDNQFKQNRLTIYNKQRKQKFNKFNKKYFFIEKYQFNSTTDDFNLLNRIFLRENQNEFNEKPYLAIKYQQQSNIQRDRLNHIIHLYPFQYYLTSKSTTNISIYTTQHHTSTIII